MNIDVEAQVWRLACSHYPEQVMPMLLEALGSYQRRPGLDAPTRVGHVALGGIGFELLGQAL